MDGRTDGWTGLRLSVLVRFVNAQITTASTTHNRSDDYEYDDADTAAAADRRWMHINAYANSASLINQVQDFFTPFRPGLLI